MLVINSIEKTRLSADSYSYSGTGVAWKARLVLFLGFALMAGGLAGSVVSNMQRLGKVKARRSLTTAFTGCPGTQIPGPGIPFSNIVFWCCKCYRKWVDYAEVFASDVQARLHR